MLLVLYLCHPLSGAQSHVLNTTVPLEVHVTLLYLVVSSLLLVLYLHHPLSGTQSHILNTTVPLEVHVTLLYLVVSSLFAILTLDFNALTVFLKCNLRALASSHYHLPSCHVQ
jgi:hypothetical protein